MHQTISTLLNHALQHNDQEGLVARNCFEGVEFSCPVDEGVGHRIPHHFGPPVCMLAFSAFFKDQSVFEPAREDR